MHLGLVKNYLAGGTIAQNTMVKFSADDTVVAAAAATDAIIGVCIQPGGVSNGDRCDVQLDGIPDLKVGTGGLTRGALVTSDASGQAIVAAPASGVDNRILGWATKAAAAGDLVGVKIAISSMQGV